MSGVEPFAVTSLILQLLSGCLCGIQTISHMKGTKDEVRSAVLMLKLEEYRLTTWSLRSGASDGLLHSGLDENLVHRTLRHLKSLIGDTKTLCSSYGLAVQDSQPVPATTSIATGITRGRTFPTFLSKKIRTISVSGVRSQITWVLQDKSKFDRLLAIMRSLIDVLHQGLGDINFDTMREDIGFLRLQMVNLADKIDDVRSVTQAIEINEGLDSDACTCAVVKALRIGMETTLPMTTNGTTSSPILPESMQTIAPLRPRLLTSFSGNNRRGFANYDGSPVFVEWKRIVADETVARGLRIERQVATLATLLSIEKGPTFRSLRCLGSFEDTANFRYGFVYTLPNQSQSRVVSLFDLFYDSAFKASLTMRLELAQNLAITLLHIHTAGWLHKGIRSSNVLFFSNGSPASLDQPYLMGYDFSRFDGENEVSEKPVPNSEEDLYRHPSAHPAAPSRYRKEFDVYSFGLVLMEIAKWKPLKHIAKDFIGRSGCTPDSLEQMKKTFLEPISNKVMDDLGFRAGSIYTQVVMSCLGSLSLNMSNENADWGYREDLQEAFVEKVVKPLLSCSI
ncbi:uncharacterized protein K441DRAFT_675268 [Cenococcum geophilum 1.58]|uniref:uncharacterized protein n=1 Tax=Cenococcum geophilum 1.58 TaxID=794803 RepID=UPI00358E36A8|nr:hypothetical protein K441DRAFT_675268 [Cenococcum geophilum 1.58]